MKTSKIILTTLLSVITLSTMAAKPKKLKVSEKTAIEFKEASFKKYLKNSTPHYLEGIYTTKDSRYRIAIVKNNTTTHDFIGIVLNADNPFWEEGQVKFNFVLNDTNKLEGFYYDASRNKHSVEFELKNKTIVSNLIGKIEPVEALAKH